MFIMSGERNMTDLIPSLPKWQAQFDFVPMLFDLALYESCNNNNNNNNNNNLTRNIEAEYQNHSFCGVL